MIDQIGRYKIVKKIASGGMGELYLAIAKGAQDIDKLLVIKKILPAFARNPHFVSMFVDEARITTRLNHNNIVQVYGFEQIENDYILIMEYVNGVNLSRFIELVKKKGGKIPPHIAAYIIQEVAKGLHYAHNRKDEKGELLGIVHRDVSPQNILISFEGAVKIGDFGIAKARLLSAKENIGVLKGKFAYMSPEQALGKEVDHRSDIFSLGVVFYELLTLSPLFKDIKNNLEILESLRNGKLPDIEDDLREYPELLKIIKKAIEVDPNKRYQTAKDMAYDIAKYLRSYPEIVDSSLLEEFLKEISLEEETAKKEFRVMFPTIAFVEGRKPSKVIEKKNIVVLKLIFKQEINEEEFTLFSRLAEGIAYKYQGIIKIRDKVITIYIGLTLSREYDCFKAIMIGMDLLDVAFSLREERGEFPLPSIGIYRTLATVELSLSREVTDFYIDLEDIALKIAEKGEEGSIIVAGGVFRITRCEFNYRELAPLVVKDSLTSFPLKLYLFEGVKSSSERVEEATSIIVGPFYGREVELKFLESLYVEAINENRILFVSVVGEMGIGKTRLLTEFIRRTQGEERKVVVLNCSFETQMKPYVLIGELLKELLGIREIEIKDIERLEVISKIPEEYREKARTTIIALLKGLDRAGIVSSMPVVICELLKIILVTFSSRVPLIIVIDNIHLGDIESLEIIRNLSSKEIRGKGLIFLAGRPSSELTPYLGHLKRITLRELSFENRIRFIADRVGDRRVAMEIEQLICNKTGGNPFFINEALELLLEKGVIRIDQGKVSIAKMEYLQQIPTTLEDLAQSRIDDLEEEQRMLLRWASVLGTQFTADQIKFVAGGDVEYILNKLVEKGLLELRDVEKKLYNFKYEVVRDVAYRGLTEEVLISLHQRCIEWYKLQKEFSSSPYMKLKVGYHYEKIKELKEAEKYYFEAASLFEEAGEFEEELRLYNKLKVILKDERRVVDIYIRCERIYHYMGLFYKQYECIDKIQEIAQSLNDKSLLKLSFLLKAEYYLFMNKFNSFKRSVQIVQRLIPELKEEIQLKLLLADYYIKTGRFEKSRTLIESIKDLEESKELGIRDKILLIDSTIFRYTGKIKEGLKLSAELVVINEKLKLYPGIVKALIEFGLNSFGVGKVKDGVQLLERALSLSNKYNKGALIEVLFYNCLLNLKLGLRDKAKEKIEELKSVVEQNKLKDGLYFEFLYITAVVNYNAYLDVRDSYIEVNEKIKFSEVIGDFDVRIGLIFCYGIIIWYIKQGKRSEALKFIKDLLERLNVAELIGYKGLFSLLQSWLLSKPYLDDLDSLLIEGDFLPFIDEKLLYYRLVSKVIELSGMTLPQQLRDKLIQLSSSIDKEYIEVFDNLLGFI